MARSLLLSLGLAALLALPASAQKNTEAPAPTATLEPGQPPAHTLPFPNLGSGDTRQQQLRSFEAAPQLRRGIPARDLLTQQRRLASALDGIAPQQPGVIDAYVLTVALDSDPVFAREAREAGLVLGRRYDAAGRTLVLAGPDGTSDELPVGSIESLFMALAHIADVMDPEEDVLVLYTTSHGMPLGLAYHYGDTGYGILSPTRMREVFAELGIERRILVISACFSGVFVPAMQSENTAILTAASAERSSFGCQAENDWTFFGDAMINRALRQPIGLAEASQMANRTVAGWESERGLLASLPQRSIGDGVADWLPALEARMPRTATAPVGRPSVGE